MFENYSPLEGQSRLKNERLSRLKNERLFRLKKEEFPRPKRERARSSTGEAGIFGGGGERICDWRRESLPLSGRISPREARRQDEGVSPQSRWWGVNRDR